MRNLGELDEQGFLCCCYKVGCPVLGSMPLQLNCYCLLSKVI